MWRCRSRGASDGAQERRAAASPWGRCQSTMLPSRLLPMRPPRVPSCPHLPRPATQTWLAASLRARVPRKSSVRLWADIVGVIVGVMAGGERETLAVLRPHSSARSRLLAARSSSMRKSSELDCMRLHAAGSAVDLLQRHIAQGRNCAWVHDTNPTTVAGPPPPFHATHPHPTPS